MGDILLFINMKKRLLNFVLLIFFSYPIPSLLACGPTMITQAILFQAGSAKIEEGSIPILNQVVQLLKNHGHEFKFVEVSGRSDVHETAKRNFQLSKQRAETVVAYLVAAGISVPLRVKYSGSTDPFIKSVNQEDWIRNQRVDFYGVPRPQPPPCVPRKNHPCPEELKC